MEYALTSSFPECTFRTFGEARLSAQLRLFKIGFCDVVVSGACQYQPESEYNNGKGYLVEFLS